MQIKNGIVSNLFDDAQIEDINSHFNGKYPGIDAEISVNLNRKNYDDESCQELVLRYVFRYKHPLSPKEKTWFFLEQEDGHHDVYKGIESTLEKHSVQTKTCNHYFIRPKDEFGSEYPDGRGRCVKCELELKDILEPIPNISIIKMSMSSNGVVAKFDWGKTFVQGGDSGIVFSRRKSYTTAFVEAFPKINGMGTFIRGEGEDVKSAEDACWEKYQRMLKCDDHEWDRNVDGTLRDDGYAQCKKCKMATSDALLPTTTCIVCKKASSKTFGDGHICYTHYFEKSEDENLENHLNMIRGSGFSLTFNLEKESFDFLFIFRAERLLFDAIGEEDYLLLKSKLRQIIAFMKHNFYVLVLDHHPLKNKELYTDAEYHLVNDCHQLMMDNLDLVLEHVKNDGPTKLTYKHFIPEEYWGEDS
jgi:hypothetical protein|tara:strand:+ start:1303 stop:2550 length:1248 start_codon:yes stop_codon:yes gene_type:complete